MKMGNGELPTKNTAPYADSIEIPQQYVTTGNLAAQIFPDDLLVQQSTSIINRAILCPTNRETIVMNHDILERLPGERRVYSSSDSIVDSDDPDDDLFSVEYLNSLTQISITAGL